MIKIADKSKCSGCYACVLTCSKGCISMKRDEDGFLYPSVDEGACVNCGACDKVCYYNEQAATKAVDCVIAAANKDEEIRRSSSSGGVFYSLAKTVIEDNGVVFGAAFDENFYVAHKEIKSSEDIRQLQGSKYVQSDLRKCFAQVKDYLKAGRKVLFIGTPCQVSGLLSYLKGDHENLLTMDFICHGVPSPMVWRKYLDEMINKYNSPIKNVSFRSKEKGWKMFSMRIEFENGEIYSSKVNEDPYLRSFIMDIHLRRSCNDCEAKGVNRSADITVADFWGIGKISESMNDDRGASVVIIRGEKASSLFEKINDDFVIAPCDIDTVVKLNPSIVSSVSENELRPKFLRLVRNKGFGKAYRRYCDTSFISKIHRKLKF